MCNNYWTVPDYTLHEWKFFIRHYYKFSNEQVIVSFSFFGFSHRKSVVLSTVLSNKSLCTYVGRRHDFPGVTTFTVVFSSGDVWLTQKGWNWDGLNFRKRIWNDTNSNSWFGKKCRIRLFQCFSGLIVRM